jgi:hypothetical protein
MAEGEQASGVWGSGVVLHLPVEQLASRLGLLFASSVGGTLGAHTMCARDDVVNSDASQDAGRAGPVASCCPVVVGSHPHCF